MPTVNQVERAIKALRGFEAPKVPLEQYATDAHLASRMMVLLEDEYQALEDLVVADLGCGSGVLTFAASLFSPLAIFAVDIDPAALHVFVSNKELFSNSGYEAEFIEPILGDVLRFPNFFRGRVDTVISNPPFGTKNNAGVDVEFVKVGLRTGEQVFSLHKTSTRNFLERKVGGKAIASLGFDIPNQFSFHKKKNATVEVDLVHFEAPIKVSGI